ncbi:hypothetical protein GGP41_003532 [Bipolaris sorokiniana]|uniref:Uncharacterized protein n=1 Tax=Cochliobolus sativus TaxID=45130 RepID=A0A8H5ZDI1_COCSA|nr:hypothetical protein GGP41_003532 [Bipolaris sorokiniana]
MHDTPPSQLSPPQRLNTTFSSPNNPIPRCCELFRHVPASVSCLASPLAERRAPFFSQSVPRQTDLDSCSGQPAPIRASGLSDASLYPSQKLVLKYFLPLSMACANHSRVSSIHYGHPPPLPPRASEIRTLGPHNRAPTTPGNQQPSSKPLPSTASHLHAYIQHEHEQPACTPPHTILHTRLETAPTLLLLLLLLFAQMQTSFVAAGP